MWDVAKAKCVLVIAICLSLVAFPHYCTDLDVSWGNGKGCHLVVHYWADLQSVHGFRCYDNIAPNVKCQRVLVFTLCLVIINIVFLQDTDIFIMYTYSAYIHHLVQCPFYFACTWYRHIVQCFCSIKKYRLLTLKLYMNTYIMYLHVLFYLFWISFVSQITLL